MSVEDQLRRRLSERGASVRTAPDEPDLARRIRRSDRSATRAQRAALVASLVVVAGSVGGVVGAVVNKSGTVPVLQDSRATGAGATAAGAHAPLANRATKLRGVSGTAPTHSSSVADGTRPVSVRREARYPGLSLEWAVTPLEAPVEVLPGSGQPAVCAKASVVAMTVVSGAPIAAGSGVVGMPALSAQGLAVVSSGSFGSPGHPAGWWAIVEAGSAAADVAVQFPSGSVVRETVSGGVAVVATLVPSGASVGTFSDYASAVADGPQHVTSSLEFLLGGGVAAVGAASGVAPAGSAQPCPAQAAIGSVPGRPTGEHWPAGPPAPLMAAGNVVGAFEQAYDINPLLGLAWNFSAVDLGSSLGCPDESFGVSSAGRQDGLSAPDVEVDAVSFAGPSEAVVIYQRGNGLRETGTATLVNGTWKVSRSTYCGDMAAPPAA